MFLSRQKIAEWFLRLSLGGMYLYSGLDLVRHPGSWKWAITQLPDALEKIPQQIGIEKFIQIQGAIELLFATFFIVWFFPKMFTRGAALLSTIQMIAIVLLVGVDGITFRDIGLIGAGAALFLLI